MAKTYKQQDLADENSNNDTKLLFESLTQNEHTRKLVFSVVNNLSDEEQVRVLSLLN